ncbi:MAG: hypothetical protein R3253_15415, partial [Longimicrobiales bacterium]|nr:hypothetical protein [Longimicrobiales bacterium]
PRDTATVVDDGSNALGSARAAQRRFESRRVRLLPLTHESFGGSCDEIVGRICTTFDEGEWYPEPEREEITALRLALLAELDSLQEHAPADGWILGQRVWYRAEGEDWEGAREVAAACGSVDRWWCLALEGFALHGLQRYELAERSFETALVLAGGERALRWRVPRWPVDGRARELLDVAQASPFGTSATLRRLWSLADPLYLVEGNDRLTEHYARWTATEIRDGARNPFLLPWGDDLTQLTVRHGWQVGWERTPTRDFGALDNVVGHNHPLGRDYMPAGEVLADPAGAAPEAMHPQVRHPRSLYAPPYAPVLLPMEGQVAVFPRGATMAVVATHFLPEDTTFHADHEHPKPWLEPGDQESMVDRIGLFALPVPAARRERNGSASEATERRRAAEGSGLTSGRSLPVGVLRSGTTNGATLLELPTADYVLSAESWSPSRRRAGRLRLGVPARPAPSDIATLSDILILRPAGEVDPTTLEAALDLALGAARLRPGEPFAIGWEVAGLGFRPETLAFDLSVARPGRGLLGRIGDFLGVTDPPPPLRLSWEEPGPDEPGHVFRYLELDVPELEDGEYEIRLTLRTAGRSEAVATKRFQVAVR